MRKSDMNNMLIENGFGHLVGEFRMKNYSRELESLVFSGPELDIDDDFYGDLEEDYSDLIFEIEEAADFLGIYIEDEMEMYVLGNLIDGYLLDIKKNKREEFDLFERAEEFYKKIENLEGIKEGKKEEYLESIKDILSYSREAFLLLDVMDSMPVSAQAEAAFAEIDADISRGLVVWA